MSHSGRVTVEKEARSDGSVLGESPFGPRGDGPSERTGFVGFNIWGISIRSNVSVVFELK